MCPPRTMTTCEFMTMLESHSGLKSCLSQAGREGTLRAASMVSFAGSGSPQPTLHGGAPHGVGVPGGGGGLEPLLVPRAPLSCPQELYSWCFAPCRGHEAPAPMSSLREHEAPGVNPSVWPQELSAHRTSRGSAPGHCLGAAEGSWVWDVPCYLGGQSMRLVPWPVPRCEQGALR